jgi:cytoskeletal protein RodZ
VDFLEALEQESFEDLHGDVYVRGFLRSYAQYLGLNPDKVVSSYTKNMGEPEAPSPPSEELRSDRRAVPTFRTGHRTSSLVLAGGVALLLLIMAGALGLLSASRSTPPPATLPTVPPSVAPAGRHVTVSLVAAHEVNATITVDDVQAYSGILQAKEARSFSGMNTIKVEFSRGGVVTLMANGKDLGAPGQPSQAYSATFSPPPTKSPSAPTSSSPSGRRESPSPIAP